MRKLAIAMALASTAIATPAVARDKSFYVGLEGGAMIVEDLQGNFDDGVTTFGDAFVVNYDTGYDIDAIVGYDFGFFRLEGELAYKRAEVAGVNVTTDIDLGTNGNADGGRVQTLSAMLNGLLDFGNEDGLSGYIGGGLGWASVDLKAATNTLDFYSVSDTDSHFAFQAIAGLRFAVSPNLDLGVKYRHMEIPNFEFTDTFDGDPIRLEGDFKSQQPAAEPDLQLRPRRLRRRLHRRPRRLRRHLRRRRPARTAR